MPSQFVKFGPMEARDIDAVGVADGYVLTARNGVGAFEEPQGGGEISSSYPVADAILVSGAGEAVVNGFYEPTGTEEGKVAYALVGSADTVLRWSEDAWLFEVAGYGYYFSTEDVATPDLVQVWEIDAPDLVSFDLSNVGSSEANGTYLIDGEEDGYPVYVKVGGENGERIFHTVQDGNPLWVLEWGGTWRYYGTSQAAVPWLDNWYMHESPNPDGSLSVSGTAWWNANQWYTISDTINGKGKYVGMTYPDFFFTWKITEETGYWCFENTEYGELITSSEDVATPYLVQSWTGTYIGIQPVLVPDAQWNQPQSQDFNIIMLPGGSAEPPAVDTFSNYGCGYSLIADGAGGVAWEEPLGYDGALFEFAPENNPWLYGGYCKITLLRGGVPVPSGFYRIDGFVESPDMTSWREEGQRLTFVTGTDPWDGATDDFMRDYQTNSGIFRKVSGNVLYATSNWYSEGTRIHLLTPRAHIVSPEHQYPNNEN